MKKLWNNKDHKFIDLSTKTVAIYEINSYLKDNPTHYAFDGINRFVCNILGKICEVKRSGDIQDHFKISEHELNLTNKWFILEPCSFMEAIKAWDCGATVLRKPNDLRTPATYINDGKINRDDLLFDVVEILTGQWFIYKK